MVFLSRRARMSRRRSAEMPFTSVKRPQQLFACPVSVETVPIKIWNQKGSLSIATVAEYTRTLCNANSMPDLSCPAGMTQTQLPRFAQTPLPRCADAVVTISVRSRVNSLPLAMTSSCGGLKTLPRIRQRGVHRAQLSGNVRQARGR